MSVTLEVRDVNVKTRPLIKEIKVVKPVASNSKCRYSSTPNTN